MLPPLDEIPQDARRMLLIELSRSGRVKPGTLGVSRSYLYKMKVGLKLIPNHILEKLLELADDDTLARVPFFAKFVDYSRVKGYDVDRMVKLVVEWAKANPASARVLLSTLEAELEKLGVTGLAVKVTRSHWEEWLNYLEVRRSSGTLGVKQYRDHRNYLRRLLDLTGWVISPGLVRRVVIEVASEHPKSAAKMLESVRLFTREILQDRRLYEALPRFRPRSGRSEAPSWEDICSVLKGVEYPPAKALLYLALSGLRIETLYIISYDKVDLDQRVIAPMSDRRYKRDWFSFIPKRATAYLREVYLPWREIWLETRVKGQEQLRDRFIPVKPRRLRQEIYRVMEERLGYRFQLRLIRHRVTTQLSLYMGSLWVEILTGHAPHRIVQEHYLQRDVLEQMREKYDEAMSRVPCIGGD